MNCHKLKNFIFKMRISGERLGELGSVLFKGSLSFTTCVTTFPIFCVLCTHDRFVYSNTRSRKTWCPYLAVVHR